MNSILEKLDEMKQRREAATPGPSINSSRADAEFIAVSRVEHEILEKALRQSLLSLQIAYEDTGDRYFLNVIEEIENLFEEKK